MSEKTKVIIKRRKIVLTTWRELMQRRQNAAAIDEATWK
jgi:hypothetical protein